MRRGLHIVLIVLTVPLCCVGGYYATSSEGYGHGIARSQRGIRVTGQHLQELKALLREHKARHGAYPTNEKGLAALDAGQRCRTWAVLDPNAGTWRCPLLGLARRGTLWAIAGIAGLELDPNAGTRQELREALLASHRPSDVAGWRIVEVEVISGQTATFPVTSAGLMSPWWLPYGYENRSRLDADAFHGSPVESDRQRRYSVEVDEGVYVYCVGAELLAEEIDALRWRDTWPRLLGGLLIAGSILLLIAIKGRAVRLAGAGVIVCSSLLGASVGSTVSVSCYLMTTVFFFRSPRTVVRRKALLTKYNAAGVISDAAYDRSLAAIDLKDLDAPTTAPAAERPPQPSEAGNRAVGSASD